MAKTKTTTTKRGSGAPGYRWDDRGAFLLSLRASFVTWAEADAWESVVRAARMKVVPTDENGAFPAAVLSVLELPPKKDGLVLAAAVHDGTGHEPKRARSHKSHVAAHWTFDISRAPSGAPPTPLLEASDRLGGLDSAIRELASSWPRTGEIRVQGTATYMVKRDKLPFEATIEAALSRPKHSPSEGVSISPVGTIWTAKRGKESIYVTTFAARKVSSITWSGHAKVHFSASFIAHLDDAIWLQLKPFFGSTET